MCLIFFGYRSYNFMHKSYIFIGLCLMDFEITDHDNVIRGGSLCCSALHSSGGFLTLRERAGGVTMVPYMYSFPEVREYSGKTLSYTAGPAEPYMPGEHL